MGFGFVIHSFCKSGKIRIERDRVSEDKLGHFLLNASKSTKTVGAADGDDVHFGVFVDRFCFVLVDLLLDEDEDELDLDLDLDLLFLLEEDDNEFLRFTNFLYTLGFSEQSFLSSGDGDGESAGTGGRESSEE